MLRTHASFVQGALGGAPARRSWRATAACRVFGLALAFGQVVNTETLSQSLPALVALSLLAMVGGVLALGQSESGSAWIPVVEAMLAATLLAGALPSHALYVYLAVPAVVAGISRGWVTALNATLAAALAFFVTSLSTHDLLRQPESVAAAALWLLVGLGAGLLAGWQTRSLRRMEVRQGPYSAAHRLVAQLGDLTRRAGVGLDCLGAAQEVDSRLRDLTAAARSAVYVVTDSGSMEMLTSYNSPANYFQDVHRLAGRRARSENGTAGIPLRVGDHLFGAVILDREVPWSGDDLDGAQGVADELAIRLATALRFDEIRLSATSEERNRLARDIHDGIAQEIVALSYLVDDIESTSAEPETLATAATMREEITRVVGELRFSIFDLRHEVDGQNLSGALAEYVREISTGSDLRVHLMLDEHGPPLSRRTESELLRIAQEAISNVRKHAGAENLWVALATDGSSFRLEIADDGVGSASPRDRHYGLHTMRERAEHLVAVLSVKERAEGGTVVSLTSRGQSPTGPGAVHEHHSLAGR